MLHPRFALDSELHQKQQQLNSSARRRFVDATQSGTELLLLPAVGVIEAVGIFLSSTPEVYVSAAADSCTLCAMLRLRTTWHMKEVKIHSERILIA